MAGDCHSMTVEEITEIIPHRFPFLLVDRIVEMAPAHDGSPVGRWVHGIKNVTINEPFFTGHFPHKPVMPGVLLLETMAQVGALACYRPNDPKMDVAIAKIDNAKFRRPVVPGDQLHIRVEVLKEKSKMLLLSCRAEVDGELAASAEILAYVVPLSSLKK